jgi:hypothetical protein
MTDILNRRPNDVLAERLPPMDPKVRAELIDLAKAEVYKLLVERSKAMGARERAERRKLRGENALAHGIAKAELRIHRRLLALMEASLKAEHGDKSWQAAQVLKQSAAFRRLKRGRGSAGTGSRKRLGPERAGP